MSRSMSRSVAVVDEELIESPLAPKTRRRILRNQLSITSDLQFTHYHASNRRTVQTPIALRREVTVPDFMQSNVDIIDLPTGVSLETILLKPPTTTHSEGTKLAVCLHLGPGLVVEWRIRGSSILLVCLLTHFESFN